MGVPIGWTELGPMGNEVAPLQAQVAADRLLLYKTH